jgi:hypothetical protein
LVVRCSVAPAKDEQLPCGASSTWPVITAVLVF